MPQTSASCCIVSKVVDAFEHLDAVSLGSICHFVSYKADLNVHALSVGSPAGTIYQQAAIFTRVVLLYLYGYTQLLH